MLRPGLAFREIFKELFSIFVLCLAVFLSLLLIGKMLKLQQVLFSLDLSFFDISKLFFYLSPFFLLLLIPVACMVSMFLTFQRMSADRELVALRSAGISLAQILPAPVLFLLICAAVNLGISFYGISWGMHNFQMTLLQLAKSKAQLSLQPGVFNQEFKGLSIYAENVNRKSGEISGVFLQDNTNLQTEVIIVAPKGNIVTDPGQGKIFFSLSNGSIYRQVKDRNSLIRFSRYRVALDMGDLLEGVDVDSDEPDSMSWPKILESINNAQSSQSVDRKYILSLKVEKHKRLALPVACLVLGFFALPLGWIFEGMKRHYGGLVVLAMFFVYYSLFTLGMGLGETGVMPPMTVIWIPNFLFALFALVCFRFAHRESGHLLLGIWKKMPFLRK